MVGLELIKSDSGAGAGASGIGTSSTALLARIDLPQLLHVADVNFRIIREDFLGGASQVGRLLNLF